MRQREMANVKFRERGLKPRKRETERDVRLG
jgi:hypothetical protein